jgi:hypothetical protein
MRSSELQCCAFPDTVSPKVSEPIVSGVRYTSLPLSCVDMFADIHSSHTNVHSSVRPHYCPVKGCPRGEGGKGFKRKNEMIRHGLVHQSPGYVCPFCPDREHKYPRPDNLQRCVGLNMSFVCIRRDRANANVIGMYVCIIPTRTRTTLNSVMFLRSVPKVGAVDGEDE